ncbi:hypothetical protein BDZ97DRAFT_1924334 [Flammula alnicola]|nr:hypothetical protein BDZ97DRAFT_1924334 [Flammula alnicola]
MFDRRWRFRRERIMIYQLAMLISLAAECTATYSLAKYENHQGNIERISGYTASVHNNDIIAAACLTIVFCVLVATLFGADFFFLLFWPRRRYPVWYNASRKALAVGITLGMAAATLMSTIVVARHAVFITGVSPSTAQRYLDIYFRPPIVYRKFPQNIAWVVLLWLAFLSTVASTFIMFIAVSHEEHFGTDPSNENEKDTEPLPIHDERSSGNDNNAPALTEKSNALNTDDHEGGEGVTRAAAVSSLGAPFTPSQDVAALLVAELEDAIYLTFVGFVLTFGSSEV